MVTVAVNGTPREDMGKKSTKAVRNAGLIPCVMYGGEDIFHFTTTFKEIKNLVYTPDFKIAEIHLNGNTYRCILKEAQFHPVKENVLHLDFLQLVENKAIRVEIPVHFRGVSLGEKDGGKMIQSLRRIKVKTTPENLVDELLVDISNLELGQSIRVRDIDAHEGMEIINAPGIPIATVEVPRVLRSEEAEEAEAAEEAEKEAAAEVAETTEE